MKAALDLAAYHAAEVLRDGRPLTIRALQPRDRDLLVEAWLPFEPMRVVAAKCDRVARVLAAALDRQLRS